MSRVYDIIKTQLGGFVVFSGTIPEVAYIKRIHIKMQRTYFPEFLKIAVLKISAGRQFICFLPCIHQNYARKSVHSFYVNTL